MTITVYGDSILKGVLLEDGKYTVNRDWESRLSERYGLQIRNRSRFGCTIRKALEVIRRDCETAPEDQGVAVLELGGNDCDYDWAAISADPEGSYLCRTPPEEFVDRYRKAVELLRSAGREPVIFTLPPIHSARYLRFICRRGLSADNILRWLGDVEAISRWQENYSALAERVARETGAGLLDLRSAFPRSADALAELLCADGIHPSRAGQSVIYQTLCGCVG